MPLSEIRISTGVGVAATRLPAFDAALYEAEVQGQIQASLTSMREYRPETFGPVQSVLRGARCSGQPVSALVAATYEAQPW